MILDNTAPPPSLTFLGTIELFHPVFGQGEAVSDASLLEEPRLFHRPFSFFYTVLPYGHFK